LPHLRLNGIWKQLAVAAFEGARPPQTQLWQIGSPTRLVANPGPDQIYGESIMKKINDWLETGSQRIIVVCHARRLELPGQGDRVAPSRPIVPDGSSWIRTRP